MGSPAPLVRARRLGALGVLLSCVTTARGEAAEPAPLATDASGSGAGTAPELGGTADLGAPAPRARSPWPELAAVFPGVLVHGSGVWLQHRDETATRLLLLEGASVLATLTAGLVLFETGAARDVVGPTALVAVAGVSTFALSLATNLYATWAPADGFGEPLVRLPLVETSLGYLYVYDPQFSFRHLGTAAVSAHYEAWHVRAGAMQAASGDNTRLELGAGYRVLGPRGYGAVPASDGSYLEPRLAFSQQRFPDDGFSSRVFELALEGRLDFERYLHDVRGIFFQGEAGWARQVFHNFIPGPNPSTVTSLLLAHAGFGVYLGNRAGDATGGELELYYDHRHDGYAGGLKVNGLGSGPAGHFGLRGAYQLTPRWGLRLRTEAGSAYTLGLDAVFRAGLP